MLAYLAVYKKIEPQQYRPGNKNKVVPFDTEVRLVLALIEMTLSMKGMKLLVPVIYLGTSNKKSTKTMEIGDNRDSKFLITLKRWVTSQNSADKIVPT